MNETLQQLVRRRLLEMGARRGRSGPLSLREAWLALPMDADGRRQISYEIVRRIEKGEHTNIGDRAADALATMLDTSVSEVLAAAGQRLRLGRFELPRRADRLTDRERRVVVELVDLILEAADQERGESSSPAAGDRVAEVVEVQQPQQLGRVALERAAEVARDPTTSARELERLLRRVNPIEAQAEQLRRLWSEAHRDDVGATVEGDAG